MEEDEKVIHFGYFVRWKRERKGWNMPRLSAATGISVRRLIDIERMPEPGSFGDNLARLATALGIDPDDLDSAWRSTRVPIPPPPRKPLDPLIAIQRLAEKRKVTADAVIEHFQKLKSDSAKLAGDASDQAGRCAEAADVSR